MDDLKKAASKGALWQFSGSLIFAVLRLGSSTILARLLTPQDFGIVGMGSLAINALGYLGNLGMGAAVIVKKELSDEDLSTAFTIILINRLILFTLAILSAPYLGQFFKDDRVVDIIRAGSLVLLYSAFDSLPRSMLQKRLCYKEIFLAQSATILIEIIIAISLVLFFHLNYWALILATLISMFISTIIVNYFVPIKYRLRFDKTSYSFYKKYLFSGLYNSIIIYFKHNIDYLLVGRILGAAPLGYYEYAYKIPHLYVDRFVASITTVLFPTLSKVQDDLERFRNGLKKALQIIAFTSIPVLLGLAVYAKSLVPILWGDQWTPIIIPLQILSITALIACLTTPICQIFWIIQKPNMAVLNNFIQCAVTMTAVGYGGYVAGLNGVALGMLIGISPSLIFAYIALKEISFSARTIWSILTPIFLISFTSIGVSVFLYEILIQIYESSIFILIDLLVYIIILLIQFYFFMREAFNDLSKIFFSILEYTP